MWFASKPLFIQVPVNEITLREPCCTTTKLKIQGPPLSTAARLLHLAPKRRYTPHSTDTILSIAQEETQYRPIAYRMYLKTLAELKTGLKKRKRPKICQPPEQIVISSHAVKF